MFSKFPSDDVLAAALVEVLGRSSWDAVALAAGYLRLRAGGSVDDAARTARDICTGSLTAYRSRLEAARSGGLIQQLARRERTGSAENAVPKLFPAVITEQRFVHLFEQLRAQRPSVEIRDDRESGHGLTDFTLLERDAVLPINVKNAGTRFENAKSLVGLDPDDCLPIPAYKAHAAIEKHGHLIYVIAVDYGLVGAISETIPPLLSEQEALVWKLLQDYGGARVKSAEDVFVHGTVIRHWGAISERISHPDFVSISARRAVRILNTMPSRTPGIGIRAWGTGASGEVNVHISLRSEATPWSAIAERIARHGLQDIVSAVNRRRTEVVYDPEI